MNTALPRFVVSCFALFCLSFGLFALPAGPARAADLYVLGGGGGGGEVRRVQLTMAVMAVAVAAVARARLWEIPIPTAAAVTVAIVVGVLVWERVVAAVFPGMMGLAVPLERALPVAQAALAAALALLTVAPVQQAQIIMEFTTRKAVTAAMADRPLPHSPDHMAPC